MFSWNKSKILAPIKSIITDYHNFSRYRSLNRFINHYGLLSNAIDYRFHRLSMYTGKRQYKLTWLLEKGSVSCKRCSDFNLLWNLSKRHLKNRTFELELVCRAFVRVVEHESKNEGSDFTICPLNLTPIKELRHKIYQNSNSRNCHEIEWNIQLHVQSCCLAHKTNPPCGKRLRLYILPQSLSNLTRPITHNVIFFLGGGGRGAKFVPVIATLPILGLKFIKLFCAFLRAILWFSCAKNCG